MRRQANRYRHLPGSLSGFSQDEFTILLIQLTQAFEEAKDLDGKSDDWVQGVIYTRVRQNIKYNHPKHRLAGVFAGQLRYMSSRMNQKERKQFVQLYNKALLHNMQNTKDTPEDTIEELKMIVADTKRSVQVAELTATNAENCANELAKVEQMLQGDE